MSAVALPVLMYHHVSPTPGLVTVTPSTFEAQMGWLSRHGYRSVGARELAAFLAGEPLPEKSVAITFDDGYLDNYVHAHPVLLRFGLTAVLFLITGRIGDGPVRPHAESGETPVPLPGHRECMTRIAAGDADGVMLRWSEVAVMSAAGSFEFHSHTHTHTRWDRQLTEPAARREALGADLAASRRTLEERLGAASNHLCWPEGYYDDDYRRVALQCGFRHLYTTRKGINTPATNPEEINRVVVKDRPEGWFGRRLWLYRHPGIGGAYLRLRGE